jgi:hypothetical protein
MNENPIDRLEVIAEQLRLVLGDTEGAAWLQQAIDAHVRDDAPLDETLGLAGNGPGRSPRWRILDRQQAMLIREVLSLCGGNKAALAREIKRYKLRLAPIYASKEPPADWPPLRRLIHALCRLKGAPDTAQGIGYLIERN